SSAICTYRPTPRRVRRRVESIYSKRSEKPKTACQRKPTAPLAPSSTDRRDFLPRTHLRSPHRPRPCHPRPQQARNSYSTQLCLTGSARWRYTSAHKKGGLKILSIEIIHPDTIADPTRRPVPLRSWNPDSCTSKTPILASKGGLEEGVRA